jgi:hypothetical protein
MIARGDIVLLDTNVIIEAHRTRCWKALAQSFRLETVEECCVEAATGDRRRSDYVPVNMEAISSQIVVHAVGRAQLAQTEMRLSRPDLLDPGEKHLLAHALEKPGAWYLSASDRAAVRAGNELGFLERFVSLEALARAVGITPQFKNHFTEKWLSALRTDILMGGSQ